MSSLQIGSRGKSVTDLQNLLNTKLSPSPRLRADGEFGGKTQKAVINYQKANWLTTDGIAGKCTMNALIGNEKFCVLHNIWLVAQPTTDTCWAAATAMLLGLYQAVKLPAELAYLAPPDTGLLNDADLSDPINRRAYCDYFDLRLHLPQSYTPDGLYDLIRFKPAIASLLWDTASYLSGNGSSGHMVVIAGIRGNGEADGTTLRIYDPWPVSQGKIASPIYSKIIQANPTYIYHLYQQK